MSQGIVRVLVVFSLVISQTGCTLFSRPSEARKLTAEASWVRSTLKKEFFAFRRANRMTPIVLEKLVIEGNAIDGIVAYQRRTGLQQWRLDITNGVEGGAQVAGDKLYFGASDGMFYCVNVATGKVLWTFAVRAETLAAPTVENGIVYFQNGADFVFALDATTGKQIWFYNRQVTTSISIRATTKPVVAGDAVLVGFSDGFVVALKKRDGALLWERKIGKGKRFEDVDSTPVVDGSQFFVASYDGALYSLKVESGEINWSVEEGAYVPVTVGQGRSSDRLFYSTVNGKILVLDKNSGQIRSTFKVAKGIATQISLFKGNLVYGESEGALVIADAESGEMLTQYDPGDGILARAAVIDGSGEIYFMSNAANLYAMRVGYQRDRDHFPWAGSPPSAK